MNFILKYTVYSVVLGFVLEYIVLRIINSKNASFIYRISSTTCSIIWCITCRYSNRRLSDSVAWS